LSKAYEAVTTLLKIWDDVKEIFEHNKVTIRKMDQETQDLLHEIEFGNLSAAQRMRVFNELREIRQERRRLKNENEALEPLYNILAHKSFSQLKIDLHKAQGAISRIIETQAARSYKPRVRTDLTICTVKSNSSIDEHNADVEELLKEG